MRRLLLKVVFLIVLFFQASISLPLVGLAGPRSDDPPADSAKHLMLGLRDNRERLRQGIVKVQGKKLERRTGQDPLQGDVRQFYAFDFDAGLLRYEREEPRRALVAASINDQTVRTPENTPVEVQAINRLFYRKPGSSVQFTAGSHNIVVSREDSDPPIYSAFDVRAVGLLYLESYHQQDSFDRIFGSFDGYPADEVSDEGNGIYRIQWTIAHHRRTLWIDRSRGFSAVRLELRDQPYAAAATDPWGEPYCTSAASWEEISGVWVPKTFWIEDTGGNPGLPKGRRKFARFEHSFDWESVNTPLPPELFEIESLNAPKGSLVVDWRGQTPIVESVIGEPNSPFAGELSDQTAIGEEPAAQRWSQARWVFVIVNAIVVGFVLIFIGKRWFLQRTGQQ